MICYQIDWSVGPSLNDSENAQNYEEIQISLKSYEFKKKSEKMCKKLPKLIRHGKQLI